MAEAHVIVVGGGISGLTAAFDLAHRGVRVTLLEQHAAPGGKMRQIEIGEHKIDSGPTVFTMRWIFEDLFREAGLALEDHLELHASDLLARHAWPDGSRLDLYADVARSQSAIEAFAGAEDAARYGEFAAASAEIFRTLDLSFMRDQRPSPVALAGRVGLRGI
ncbi:MAG: FAD-dependent oxidoreductase, partial [Pseudomonadota bacterium]